MKKVQSEEGLLAPFKALKKTISQKEKPRVVSLHYMLNYLRIFGLWPRKSETNLYRSCNFLIMICLITFILTLTSDLYDASGDVLTFGDDLVVLLGLCLIIFKICIYNQRTERIESILEKIYKFHEEATAHSTNQFEIAEMQRKFFVFELLSFSAYTTLGVFLICAICLQPFITHAPLPYRAKLPFQLHVPHEHPNFVIFIYAFQCVCTVFNVFAIIVIDNLGSHCISQTTLNLRILCLKLRCLKSKNVLEGLRGIVHFHQDIIGLVNDVNNCFYSTYVLQMAASTFIICLTAFETLLARDQPFVAVKFVIYMISAFMQLFYWCFMGNLVYFDVSSSEIFIIYFHCIAYSIAYVACVKSLKVATTAFEVEEWYQHSIEFRHNLYFIIQRAQKPLVFRPKPLVAFSFETFTTILSTSYSYFALLRTMIE